MSRPTIITTGMARKMRELRELGVPVAKIARDMGVHQETVRRHTDKEEEARIVESNRIRKQRDKLRPDIMERRRKTAREYAARLREKNKLKEPVA